MTPDIHREREVAIYRAALGLIEQGVNPSAMKVQQIACAAGIGKGTVYEYFSSKDEILLGVATYCFDCEIERIDAAFSCCATLSELQQAVLDYLQDLVANRMGIYHVIAGGLGIPRSEPPAGVRERVTRLRAVTAKTVERLQKTGALDPAESPDYFGLALLSAALGGFLCLSVGRCTGQDLTPVPGYIQTMIHRLLDPMGKGDAAAAEKQ